ncbi:hypothetical protein [Catenuloplanes indicus]|uniref:Integrase n=1 Tax=Catenuloplanes indicus TaxID=137267 RepID=A0AAE4AWM2_9ACTN|nr:hypothetical protein [Catenuloplanes indicus]MDQ0365194.1 integrase [Catenuloplanes indicus]
MSVSHPGEAELAAARLLLKSMGVSLEDLAGQSVEHAPVPTFAEYVPVVSAAVSVGSRRVYGSYWNRIVEQWGSRRIDEPTPSEISTLVEYIKKHLVLRRNSRGGQSAAEHLIGALRCLYKHAIRDGHISAADNPALQVPKPRRLPSLRRALPDSRLEEIYEVASTTGNDPVLDSLLLRLHTETACRRGGALALRFADLDTE